MRASRGYVAFWESAEEELADVLLRALPALALFLDKPITAPDPSIDPLWRLGGEGRGGAGWGGGL